MINDNPGVISEDLLVSLEPIGRVANPEEIADTVVWLSSSQASYITGVALPIDGGLSAR